MAPVHSRLAAFAGECLQKRTRRTPGYLKFFPSQTEIDQCFEIDGVWVAQGLLDALGSYPPIASSTTVVSKSSVTTTSDQQDVQGNPLNGHCEKSPPDLLSLNDSKTSFCCSLYCSFHRSYLNGVQRRQKTLCQICRSSKVVRHLSIAHAVATLTLFN